MRSSRFIDLTGQRFGRWIVLSEAERRNGHVAWRCRCDCGRTGIVLALSLRRGASRSCGCLNGNHRKLSDAQKAEAVELYGSGKSIGQIASDFGVSRQSMWDVLHRRTTLRPQLRFGAANHFHRGGPRGDDPAHNKVEKAVARGRVIRPNTCEKCGATPRRYRNGRSAIEAPPSRLSPTALRRLVV